MSSQNFINNFPPLPTIGIVLMVLAFLTALHTENLFGYSNKFRKEMEDIKNKILNDETISKKQKDEYFYFKLNEFIRFTSYYIFVFGMMFFFSDCFFN